MDSTVLQYLGFIVAALILIWAVIEVNRRLYQRRKTNPGPPHTWTELNISQAQAREEPLSGAFESEEEEEAELHLRAKQNGHHAESQQPQA